MPNNFVRRKIGKEIYFSSITDSRFKQNMIAVTFIAPLSEETASENAVAAKILTKCSKKYPTYAQLCNKLSSLYSAVLAGGVLAYGDTQITSFSVNYIDNKYAINTEKVGDEALDILLGCLFEPLTENNGFFAKITELEKKTLIDKIEAELNDKQYYASQKSDEIIFRNEPASIRDTGSAASVKRVTAKSAYNAYQRLLKRSRIEIICSGCSSFEDVKEKITRIFSKLPREDIFPRSDRFSPLKPQTERVCEKLDVQQTKMILAFKSDFENYRAMSLMSDIYGGSPTSKLFLNVREKMSLCYGCWSSYNKEKGVLKIHCGIEKANIEKAEQEIIAQLAQMQKGEFSQKDIDSAKQSCKNSIKAYNDSLNHIAVWYLMGIYDDNILSPEESIERYEKVTKEEIVKAAQSLKLDTVYILTSPD